MMMTMTDTYIMIGSKMHRNDLWSTCMHVLNVTQALLKLYVRGERKAIIPVHQGRSPILEVVNVQDAPTLVALL